MNISKTQWRSTGGMCISLDCDWIFGRAMKAIFSPGVRNPRLFRSKYDK